MPEIGSEKLREIYTNMVRTRAFEERAIKEYRKGLPGFMHPSVGQEAIPAAVCAFLRPEDCALVNHRDHGVVISKGARVDRMMAEIFAKETGYCKGKGSSIHLTAVDLNIYGAGAGIIGDNISIASGMALGFKMQKLDRVVVCFHGDGTTCTGAFYEGLSLAAIWDLPVVFVCENNQYQQSTPTRDYTRLKDLADRAKAHAIPGVSVDGNDALAVAEVVRKAIDDAREGKGPTFIVATTYRYYGHHMGDPGTNYRTKEEVEEHRKNDPIERFQSLLLQKGIITEADIENIQEATMRELDEAVKFAIESPEPELEDATSHMYYTPEQN